MQIWMKSELPNPSWFNIIIWLKSSNKRYLFHWSQHARKTDDIQTNTRSTQLWHSRKKLIAGDKKRRKTNICHQIRIKMIVIFKHGVGKCWARDEYEEKKPHNLRWDFYLNCNSVLFALTLKREEIQFELKVIKFTCHKLFCCNMKTHMGKEKTNFANYLPIKHNQSSPAVSLFVLTDIFNYQNLQHIFFSSLEVIFISRICERKTEKLQSFYLPIAHTNDTVCSSIFSFTCFYQKRFLL